MATCRLDRPQVELRWVEHDVPHALSLPGVGDVDQAVAGLNHRGIRIFAGLVFEDHGRLPVLCRPSRRPR